MPEHEITESFLKALDRYFAGEINSRDGAKEAGLSGPNKFLEILKEAYRRGYVMIRSPVDQQLCDKFRQWVGLSSKLEPYILKGKSDDRTFSLKAAETSLIYLRRLLINDKIPEVNIGIVSGSSTGSLVEALVTSNLWEDVMGEEEIEKVKGRDVKVNVIALNATPVKGWELQGDANISAFNLALLLKKKLEKESDDIKPIGIINAFSLGPSEKKMETSPIDREILEITDPNRLKNDGSKSKLDIVVTGIGSPEDSIFTQIMNSEKIEIPEETVGDVVFTPVDKDGNELPLTKHGVSHSVYSAIRLETMRQLVDSGSVVMLVARNARRGRPVNKTPAIRAAIRGRYINVICTDENTALEIMTEPA
ncbi:MAG: sugar-binding domain-containing protein [Candidatus Hodarchaeota archaeon]